MSPPFHFLQFRYFMMKNSWTPFLILKTILLLTFSFIEYYFSTLTFFPPTNLAFFFFNHLHGSQLSPLQSLSNNHKGPLGSYLGLHYLYSDRLIHSFKKNYWWLICQKTQFSNLDKFKYISGELKKKHRSMQHFDNCFNRSKPKFPKENTGGSVIYNSPFTNWPVFALKWVWSHSSLLKNL